MVVSIGVKIDLINIVCYGSNNTIFESEIFKKTATTSFLFKNNQKTRVVVVRIKF